MVDLRINEFTLHRDTQLETGNTIDLYSLAPIHMSIDQLHLSCIINLTVAECKKIRNVTFRINYFVNKYREGLVRQIDVSYSDSKQCFFFSTANW